MTAITLELTNEEAKWLSDWSVQSGYIDPDKGIIEVLKVCGAIPRGSEYYKKAFAHLS